MNILIETVRDRYKLAEANQRSKFGKFNDFDYIFNSKLKYYDPNIPSKVFNPIVWSFIETIVTRMLAKSPIIAYKPREARDETQSQIMSELFSYWFDKSQAYTKIVSWVKDALIYGTGLLKVDWFTSPVRTLRSYQYDINGEVIVDEDGKFVTEEIPTVDYDDPRIENVNIYDFFVDPKADSLVSAKWVIHQYWADIEDLEQTNKTAEPLGKVIYSKYGLSKLKNATDKKESEFEAKRKEATGFSEQKSDQTITRVKIWEMWEDTRCVIIGDERVILRDEENYFWHGKKPFIRLVDSIVPHEFYGMGEIQPVEKQLHALNTTQNQRITNVNRILSPMWKATANVDDDELQFIDNGIVHVSDMQDAQIFTMPNVTNTAVQEQNVIIETIQRSLGVTDYIQGIQTPNQTAKEVEIKTSQANARFAHKVKLLEEMGLKALGEFVYQLFQQFVTKEKVIRVIGLEGEQFIPIKAVELAGDYDVIPESDSTLAVDQQQEFEKFANLFAMLQPYVKKQIQDPVTGAVQEVGYLSEEELVKELINKSGEKNPERFYGQSEQISGEVSGQTPQGEGRIPQNSLGTSAGGTGIF